MRAAATRALPTRHRRLGAADALLRRAWVGLAHNAKAPMKRTRDAALADGDAQLADALVSEIGELAREDAEKVARALADAHRRRESAMCTTRPETNAVPPLDGLRHRVAYLSHVQEQYSLLGSRSLAYYVARQPLCMDYHCALVHADTERGVVLVNKPYDVRIDIKKGEERRFVDEPTVAGYVATQFPGAFDETRPRFGNQLDYSTSGIMVCCLSKEAAKACSRAFAERQVRKTYRAVVIGNPEFDTTTVDAPIAASRHGTTRMAIANTPDAADGDSGKASKTHFTVLRRGTVHGLGPLLEGTPCALMECQPVTGRRHQIRVHLGHLGHVIAGDATYGGCVPAGWSAAAPRDKGDEPYRMCLHAFGLSLPLPGGPAIAATAADGFDALVA